MNVEFILGEDEIYKIIEILPKDGIILLRGNLAAGKTTLVKEIVKSLGVKNEVTSPTFSILNEYDKNIFHYDIYNCGLHNFLSQGLLENLSKDGLHLIEWAQEDFAIVLDSLGIKYIIIEITPELEKRKYEVKDNA